MSERGRCKPAHLGVLGRLNRVTHEQCAPLIALPASTDLLGFRARDVVHGTGFDEEMS